MDDVRKLVYFNVCQGVPLARIAETYGMTETVAYETFRKVGLELASEMVRNAMPYSPCQTEGGAFQNRKVLIPMLDNLKLDFDHPEFRRVVARPLAVE